MQNNICLCGTHPESYKLNGQVWMHLETPWMTKKKRTNIIIFSPIKTNKYIFNSKLSSTAGLTHRCQRGLHCIFLRWLADIYNFKLTKENCKGKMVWLLVADWYTSHRTLYVGFFFFFWLFIFILICPLKVSGSSKLMLGHEPMSIQQWEYFLFLLLKTIKILPFVGNWPNYDWGPYCNWFGPRD